MVPEVLAALNQYTKNPNETPGGVLMEVVKEMARDGIPRYPWKYLRPVMMSLLKSSTDDFRAKHPGTDPKDGDKDVYEVSQSRLVSALQDFEGAPFTIQRLCELILNPDKHYSSVSKLLFGLEKLLSVSSVIDFVSSDMETGGNVTKNSGQEAMHES